MKTTAILSLIVLCGGCATVHRTSVYHGVKVENENTPIETVEIENSGWTLCKYIPLGSGNPNLPNRNTCCWFENSVTLTNNLKMLDSEMRSVNASTIANLTSRKTEENYLFIILNRHAYHTSAVLIGNSGIQQNTSKQQ